jgi:hypothetical protein
MTVFVEERIDERFVSLSTRGPSALNASITENAPVKETAIGLIGQVLSGGCTVSGSLTTTPFLTVR